MAKIVWLPSMSVGIGKWDSDHRVLLELINRLDQALHRDAADGQVVREAMQTLTAYAERHFQIEERVMERLAYPGLTSHRAEHDSMRAWIAELGGIDADAKGFAKELGEQLVHWFYTHVLTIDMRYSEFFGENRVQVEAELGDYLGLELAPA